MIATIKKHIEEYNFIQVSQKKLFSISIMLEKSLITINKLSSIIKLLKPPTIINLKRKILDLIIYLILKNNQAQFYLKPGYCPNKSFLEKILEKLKKKDANKEEIIKNKIDIVENLINENKTTIEFPFNCNDNSTNIVMKYLNFYKRKCNYIVHISEKNAKNYYLPFNKYIENDFINEINLFKLKDDENKNEINSNENIIEDDDDLLYKEKSTELDIDIAFDFLLKEKINFNIDKLEKINNFCFWMEIKICLLIKYQN